MELEQVDPLSGKWKGDGVALKGALTYKKGIVVRCL